MLTLRVIHAHFGDSLLLIHGKGDKFMLVDGGPANTFGPHLQKVLASTVKKPNKLDVVCLSHVDTDHTTGLQELFAELRDQSDDGEELLVDVGDFWINEFTSTIDKGGRNVEQRLANVFQAVNPASAMRLANDTLFGIKHGHGLALIAKQLKIPINGHTKGDPWLAGATPTFDHHGLEITVVGPNEKNLEKLRAEWDDFLDQQEKRVAAGQLDLAASWDTSMPNLSSIQLLVEAGKKKLLLTGDGRGDHLLAALEDADLLDKKGNFHVDVLKLPHHGSDRNVNAEFFSRVTADTYVVSADGTYGNPDKPTFEWILKAAKKNKKPFELVLTNLPPDADEFVTQNPPAKNNYTIRVRKDGDDFIDVPIAP